VLALLQLVDRSIPCAQVAVQLGLQLIRRLQIGELGVSALRGLDKGLGLVRRVRGVGRRMGLDLAEAALLLATDLVALLNQLGGRHLLLSPTATSRQRN